MRPFIFIADAVSIKATGQPTQPQGALIFNQLISDTRSMIADGAIQDGLKDAIESKMTELSTRRFLEANSALPAGQVVAIQEDAEALAEAIADNLSFAIVATVFNIIGATDGANPIISYANTPLDPVAPAPIPLTSGGNKVPVPV